MFGWLGAHGIAPAGPPFLKYNVIDMMRQLEIDNGVPVAAPVDGDGDMIAGAVRPPGVTPPSPTWATPVSSWRPPRRCWTGPPRQGLAWDVSPDADGERWGGRVEYYLTDPREEPDMSKWVTQLAFRLAD